jgi:hypothetical protein
MLGSPPLYSVDASALIEMEHVYRYAQFRPMWDFVGGLGQQRRLFVAPSVKDECAGSDTFSAWFGEHPSLIWAYSSALGKYLSALMVELTRDHMPLVDPNSTRHQADPQVIALALMLEERDLADLHGGSQRACHVVSYERQRRGATGLAKMRDVCLHYGLGYLEWPAVLEIEGWSVQ